MTIEKFTVEEARSLDYSRIKDQDGLKAEIVAEVVKLIVASVDIRPSFFRGRIFRNGATESSWYRGKPVLHIDFAHAQDAEWRYPEVGASLALLD